MTATTKQELASISSAPKDAATAEQAQYDELSREDLLSLLLSKDDELRSVQAARRCGLVWEDHPEEFDKASVGKLPLLSHLPLLGVSPPEGGQDHVLIKGDNYHALKALTFTHERAVDVIYIDPPYNTGNQDFKYNDKFVDREDDYRHSKWLSFMSKRLRLAKQLLKKTGVLLISIDDNEVAQLRLLCDHIFGEENFIAPIVWNGGRKNNSRFISNGHEYVLVYARSMKTLIEADVRWSVPKERIEDALRVATQCWKKSGENEELATKTWREWLSKQGAGDGVSRFSAIDRNVRTLGPYNADQDLSAPGRNGYRHEILHPETGLPCKQPEGGWRHSQKTMTKLLEEKRVQFGPDHSKVPRGKRYLSEHKTEVMESVFSKERQAAASLLADILGEGRFPYPKDIDVIAKLLRMVAPKDATVVDFFAGSGTTAHAVMQLNAEDGSEGKRQCILVTNDEGEFKDDAGRVLPGGICTNVTVPRLQKVIKGYTTPKGKSVSGLPANLHFFETKFVEEKATRSGRAQLMEESVGMLTLKEGCFKQLASGDRRWKTFVNGTKHLVVLFDGMAGVACAGYVAKLEGEVALYAFTHYEDDDIAEDFAHLPKVRVRAMPDALINTYRRIALNKTVSK